MSQRSEAQSLFSEEQKQAIKSIHDIEIRLRKRVNQTFAGEHLSAFKGQGMEFNEVRKYVRGDDAKNIDWKVTAKTNELHIKVFQEERELVFNILLDISGSQLFGSGAKSKKEVATEILATLTLASIKNRDKVGFLSFTDVAEHYLPPRRGKGHAFKIIKESALFNPSSKKSSLKNALQFFSKMQKKSSVLFILSDFLFKDDYQEILKQLVQKHSIIVFHLQDSFELSLPTLGIIRMNDLENGDSFLINTYSRSFTKDYEILIRERHEKLKIDLTKLKIKYLAVNIREDYFKNLADFFRKEIIR